MTLSTEARVARLGERAASLIESNEYVGLGTGSTAAAMVDAIGKRVEHEGLDIVGVATSKATAEQATALGIPLVPLSQIDRLDICIDGADEIDPQLRLVKGRGGALLFEKLVARRADRYVIIATDEKLVETLGTRMPLPVEIVPEGWTHTAELVSKIGMEPHLRVGDIDSPYLTDGGHFILDCDWPESGADAAEMACQLKAITGVVDHGLFIDMADVALTIDAAGEITEHSR